MLTCRVSRIKQPSIAWNVLYFIWSDAIVHVLKNLQTFTMTDDTFDQMYINGAKTHCWCVDNQKLVLLLCPILKRRNENDFFQRNLANARMVEWIYWLTNYTKQRRAHSTTLLHYNVHTTIKFQWYRRHYYMCMFICLYVWNAGFLVSMNFSHSAWSDVWLGRFPTLSLLHRVSCVHQCLHLFLKWHSDSL